MEDFENELLKLNGSLKPMKRTQQEQEEWEHFKNIQDGFIIF